MQAVVCHVRLKVTVWNEKDISNIRYSLNWLGKLRYGNEGSIRTVIRGFKREPIFMNGRNLSELYNAQEIAADESTRRFNGIMEN